MNILDLQDAWMGADMRFKQWLEEYDLAFQKPLVDMAIGQAFDMLPPEVKDIAKDMDPEGYEDLLRRYGGK